MTLEIRASTDEDIRHFIDRVHYVPTANVRGLTGLLQNTCRICNTPLCVGALGGPACPKCYPMTALPASPHYERVVTILYDQWTPNSVQMHSWIKRKNVLTRKFLREAFRFPFGIGGRDWVYGLTPGDNEVALEFNKHVGFERFGELPAGWTKLVPIIVQRMRYDQCVWYRRTDEYGTGFASDSDTGIFPVHISSPVEALDGNSVYPSGSAGSPGT